jgi:cytochrome c biogenesis protein CcmG/thiol:disulfide interchange protein DsbE
MLAHGDLSRLRERCTGLEIAMTILQRRAFLLAPLGLAAIGGVSFWTLLQRMDKGTYDPHGIPSMLIGKPLPKFSLPGQMPSQGFSSDDIVAAGHSVLINFFASWCIPCVQEAPVLMALKQQGMPIWGIVYKDKSDATTDFLKQNGDPYTRIARDEPGTVAIDFGLYGVPETYLVDKAGIVRWRWAGGMSKDVVRDSLAPLLKSLA